MRERGIHWILPTIITILAVADGLVHLRLNYVFFKGKIWGTPSFGPPPGAPAGSGPPAGFKPPQAIPGVSLPLNELFTLNVLGFILLAALLWVVLLRLGALAWVMDVVLILFTATAFVGWFRVGKPNPSGLGYFSKGIEIVLIAALVVHLATLLIARPHRSMTLSAA